MKSIGKYIFRMFYPARCLCCGRLMEEMDICRGCRALMKRVPPHNCTTCAQPDGCCECHIRPSRLDGFAAPFYNEGRARTTLYKMKFGGVGGAHRFLAKEMVAALMEKFPHLQIDVVCCVPDAHGSRRHRGYYMAYCLAEAVAKEMNCPFEPNLLKQIKPSLPQHRLSAKERADNVKGIYSADPSAKGRNLLVVDDIRTTGATLNECGKTLRKAGANTVWGLAALVGRNLQ